jgi:hypothetical protein
MAHQAVMSRLQTHVSSFMRRWAHLNAQEDGLQSLLLNKLKKHEYRTLAAIHFSARHGAKRTIDLLDTIDRVWSLRMPP